MHITQHPLHRLFSLDMVHFGALFCGQCHAARYRLAVNPGHAPADSPDTAAVLIRGQRITFFLIQKLIDNGRRSGTTQQQTDHYFAEYIQVILLHHNSCFGAVMKSFADSPLTPCCFSAAT